MKKPVYTAACAVMALMLLASTSLCKEQIKWKETKGKRFIVYTAEGGRTEGKKILAKAEECVDRTFKALGVKRPSRLWQWEGRVPLYVYPKRYQYLSGCQAKNWSGGKVRYESRGKIKKVSTFEAGDRLLGSFIPHVVAHMVICELNYGRNTTRGKIPLWLAEGLAQQLEEDIWGKERESFKTMIKDEKNLEMFSLKSLLAAPYNTMDKFTTVRLSPGGGHLLKADERTQLYYLKTVCLVGFMMNEYGDTKFRKFIRKLREGEKLEPALKYLCGRSTKLKRFEEDWQKYVEKSRARHFLD